VSDGGGGEAQEINGAYEILRGLPYPPSRVRFPSSWRSLAKTEFRREITKELRRPSRVPHHHHSNPQARKSPLRPASDPEVVCLPGLHYGAILAILLVRYFMETPKTETRPRPHDVTYAPSIPTPSPAPEIRALLLLPPSPCFSSPCSGPEGRGGRLVCELQEGSSSDIGDTLGPSC